MQEGSYGLIAAMHTDLNSKHPAISLKQLKAAELLVVLFESVQEGCLPSAHLQAISTYIHIRQAFTCLFLHCED